ncbi:HEPN domain-containing protein [Candidatus Uhrbacteria bacterium]|nr:HEPN domain-containing protein [Candidatus Uhrbacteria bacterium]
MEYQDTIRYWKNSSKKDFEVAQGLFSLKHYAHALFFCHLSLEKLLKALYVRNSHEHAPYIHDLVIIARRAKIELDDSTADFLVTITHIITGILCKRVKDSYEKGEYEKR